jgi:hypothetical protein
MTQDPPLHRLRAPCKTCGGREARLERRSGQACLFCANCGAFQYNAPKGELGEVPRAVSLHGIPASQRARILDRATGRCELCGAGGVLHIAHLLSVADGVRDNVPDDVIKSDHNLAVTCEECNLGLGSLSVSPRLYIALLMRRGQRHEAAP